MFLLVVNGSILGTKNFARFYVCVADEIVLKGG